MNEYVKPLLKNTVIFIISVAILVYVGTVRHTTGVGVPGWMVLVGLISFPFAIFSAANIKENIQALRRQNYYSKLSWIRKRSKKS